MRELADSPSAFAQARRVGRRAVLENRACCPGSVANVGECSRRVVLADPQPQPVVGEAVRRRTRVRDPRDAVFIVIRQRGGRSSRNHRLAVPVRIVGVGFAARARQVVVAVVCISVGRSVEDFRQPVLVVVVTVTDRVAGRVAVVSRLARDLIAGIVAESGHGSIGVGSRGDVVDAVVAVLVVRKSDISAGFVQVMILSMDGSLLHAP